MDKRYQVFVSSTYEDLKQERQEVIQALLELDCIPSGMELFPAADDDQWTFIKKIIDECDYYVVIIAGRYGSISPLTGKSYTQMEYEYAVEQGKPVIAFYHSAPQNIEASKTERSAKGKQKLEQFRAMAKSKLCKPYTNASELGAVVSRSIVQLRKSRPAIGWVRADQALSDSAAQEVLSLKKRIEQLENELSIASRKLSSSKAELSQGDDEILFHCDLTIKFGPERGAYYEEIKTTWNKIFEFVAPHMLHKIDDVHLKFQIDKYFHSILPLYAEVLKFTMDEESYTVQLPDHVFQTIKIQWLALDLIEKAHTNDPYMSCWSLTPRGQDLLTQIVAVKRQSKPKELT